MHNFGEGDFVNIGVGKVSFQNSAFTVSKDIGSHNFSIAGKNINKFFPNARQ